jgi:hypothetical protein
MAGGFFNAYSGLILGGGPLGLGVGPRRPVGIVSSVVFTGVPGRTLIGVQGRLKEGTAKGD